MGWRRHPLQRHLEAAVQHDGPCALDGEVGAIDAVGPAGGFSASSQPATLDHSKAQSMLFVGSRRPAAGWAHGVYRAHFTVQRAGSVVLDRSFEATL